MRRTARLITGAPAAIGWLFVGATFTPLNAWWAYYLAGPWNAPVGDVLVVPGADAWQDSIGFSTYLRSVYAVRAWRGGGFRDVVVCGGGNGDQPSVAEQMRDFMVSQGIPAAAVHLENQSRSTRENALDSKALVSQLGGRKILLTSDYHMFRAYRVFRKAGIDVQPSPFPDSLKQNGSWTNRWSVFVGLCTETSKIVYYFVRGWI